MIRYLAACLLMTRAITVAQFLSPILAVHPAQVPVWLSAVLALHSAECFCLMSAERFDKPNVLNLQRKWSASLTLAAFLITATSYSFLS